MRVNTTELAAHPRRSVYAGGSNRIGDVQERDDGFLARDRQGRELGVYDTMGAASAACWRVAQGQTRAAS
jgi:hypothetical protein